MNKILKILGLVAVLLVVLSGLSGVASANHSPTASRENPSSSEVTIKVGDTVNFEISAHDVDGNLRGAEWYLNHAHQASHFDMSGYDDTDDWSHTFNSEGDYYVEGQAFDHEAAYSDPVSWTVHVVVPKGSITVTVKYPSGSGVTPDTAILYDSSHEIDRKSPPSSNRYTFSNLNAGTYHTDAYKDNMQIGVKENINVGLGEDKSVTITTPYKRSLDVTVYYNDGSTKINGASVKVYSWDGYHKKWDYEYEGTTNSQGKVTFSSWPTTLSGEKYKLVAEHNGYSKIKEPVYVDKDSGSSYTVTLSEPVPKSSITVTVKYPDGISVTPDTAILYDSSHEIDRKSPPSSNRYTFSNLNAGTYHTDAYKDNMQIGVKENINVGLGEDKSVTLTTPYKRNLEVTVYYNDGSTKLEGATVKVYSRDGYHSTWDYEYEGTTNSQGKVTFSSWPTTLSGEKYKLVSEHNGYSKIKEPVYVDKDSGSSYTITLSEPVPKSSITVTVKYPDGSGITPDTAILYDSSHEIDRLSPSNNIYSFSNLDAGTYHTDAYKDNMQIGVKENINVGLGEDKSVTLTTPYKRNLEVTVYYNDCSTKINDATVKVYSWDGYHEKWDYEYEGTTNSQGKVTFSSWPTTLSGEKYKLVAEHNGYSKTKEPVYVDKNSGSSYSIVTDESCEERIIEFSGHNWTVKSGWDGPGPNYWSSSHENVWVDDNGQLHLRITYRDGKWYCPEIYSQETFGYGKYYFFVSSRVDELDKNVVGGLFTYEGRGETTPKEYEVDIEFSRWGVETNDNALHVFQYRIADGNPATDDEPNEINPNRFDISLSGEYSTHTFVWKNNYLHFQSYHGHYDDLPSEDYLISEKIWEDPRIPPESDEKVHLNLWLVNGKPPSNGQSAEIIIKRFEFVPILSVPYEYQGEAPWCVPASTAMVLKYYGKNVHMWDIADALDLESDEGAKYDDIVSYIQSKYPDLSIHEGGDNPDIDDGEHIKWHPYPFLDFRLRDYLISELNTDKNPVILGINEINHAVVVVVVSTEDASDPTFYVNDPSFHLLEELGINTSKMTDPPIKYPVKWSQLKQFWNPLSGKGFQTISVQGNPNPPEGSLSDVNFAAASVGQPPMAKRWYSDGLKWNFSGVDYPVDDYSASFNSTDIFSMNALIANHLDSSKKYICKFITESGDKIDRQETPIINPYSVYAVHLDNSFHEMGLNSGKNGIYIKLYDLNSTLLDKIGPITFTVKNIPPNCSVTTDADFGGWEWSRDKIRIWTDASDIDGNVTQVEAEYSTDHSIWHNVGTDYSPDWMIWWDTTSISRDDSVWIKAKAKDDSGDYSDWCYKGPYKIDNIPPITSLSLSPSSPDGENGWYISRVTFSLNAADSDSGVKKTKYKFDDWNWVNYTGPVDVNSDGEHTLRYYSIDNACGYHGTWGNKEEEKSCSFKIDETKPSSHVNPLPSTQTPTSFTISWTGSDATSDLKWYDVQYKVDSGNWQDWKVKTTSTSDTFGPNKPVTVEAGHTYYFQSRAQDNAGNWETYPGEDGDTHTTISVSDTIPPTWDTTIGIQSATDTGKGGQVEVTYGTATDAGSPPVKYNVYYSTSSPATAGTKLSNVGSPPYPVTGLTNGQLYYFTVRAEDSATPPNEDTNTVELTATPTAPSLPIITFVSPVDGATSVPVTTTISATFSEAMNVASVEAAFSITPSVAGTFSWVGNTMTFTPSANLADNTTYTVTIAATATDLAGNGLDGNANGIAEGSPTDDYTWSFTTEEIAKYGFNLSCDNPEKSIPSGGYALYDITVKNTGNMEDTIKLEFPGKPLPPLSESSGTYSLDRKFGEEPLPPLSEDWGYSLDRYNVDLLPGESTVVVLNVSDNSDEGAPAGSSCEVEVTGTSQGDPSKSDSVTLKTTVTSGPTYVSGFISTNTTWTFTGSPYIVIGDVIVEEGIELTIDPSVTVKFDNGKNLIIDGTLNARGNAINKITFTSNLTSPASGDWGTIKFRDPSIDDECIIEWAIVEYGSTGITSEGASPRIENSTISNNNVGVSGGAKITYSSIVNNSDSGVINPDTIIYSTISNNNNIGVKLSNQGCIISNSTISNNGGTGLFWDYAHYTVNLLDTTIYKNKGDGIKWGGYESSTLSITRGAILNNEGWGICVAVSMSEEKKLSLKESQIMGNKNGGISFSSDGYDSLYIMDTKISSNNNDGVRIKWGGMWFGPASLTLSNSKILNNNGTGIYTEGGMAITNSTIKYNKEFGIYSGGGGSVHYNNIHHNTIYDFKNGGSSDVNTTYNWWGTTNTTLIDQHIHDYYDDYNLGKVTYVPFLTEPITPENNPPIASSTYSPEKPIVKQPVTFDASSSYDPDGGNITEYWWNVSGTVYTAQKFIHTFTSLGLKYVGLTVTDDEGDTNSTVRWINVAPSNVSLIFEDNFSELNLNTWIPFGSPSPRVLSSAEGRDGVFDNNGDSWCNSGAVSKDNFSFPNGFTMESDMYLKVTSVAGCWNSPVIGLTRQNTPTGEGVCPTEDYPMGVIFGVEYDGDACWATPEEKRRHAYFIIGLYTEDGTWESVSWLNADNYTDAWHNFKIVVGSDRIVKFYVDDDLVYTSEKKINETVLKEKKIFLGIRSSGSAGKSYHDYIKLYATTPTTIDQIMQDAKLVEKVQTNSTVNLSAIVDDGDFDATLQGDYAVWEEKLDDYIYKGTIYYGVVGYSKSPVIIKIAVNEDGDFYLGTFNGTANDNLLIFSQNERRGITNYRDFNGNLLDKSRYGKPHDSVLDLDAKQNYLAFVFGEVYKNLYNKGHIKSGPTDYYELYNCNWSLENRFDRPIAVITSYIFHQQFDYSWYPEKLRPIEGAYNTKWSPIAKNPDQNRDLSRKFDVKHKNVSDSFVWIYVSTDNGMHSDTTIYGMDNPPDNSCSGGSGSRTWRVTYDSDARTYNVHNDNCASVGLFLNNQLPKKVQMEGRTTWSSFRPSVTIAVLGDITTSNHTESPSPGDDNNPEPLRWVIQPSGQAKEPPVALFTHSPLNSKVNQPVTFDASSSYDLDGTIVSYEWDFDDGNTATGKIVTHSYSSEGECTVKLTVTDNSSLTNSTTRKIKVIEEGIPNLAWNMTISATNQLEPVVAGMHPNATDGYDPDYDVFAQTPVHEKAILILDGIYSTSIKKTRCYNESVSWNLSVGVPTGQTTTLSWSVPSNVNLTIREGNSILYSGAELSEGSHELLVTAKLIESTTFTLKLKPGWNMVSLPLVPDNSSVYAIFGSIPTLDTMPVVTWESPSFVAVEEVDPKIGYWVFTPSDTTITVTGKSITNTTLILEAGWNMVGTVGMENLTISDISNQVPQRPAVTWVAPSFVETNVVEPGKSAWVFVTADTVVTVDKAVSTKADAGVVPTITKRGLITPATITNEWNLTISATNQLEPITFGIHPDATNGYDGYDIFVQTPVQGKVILILDDIYATEINKDKLTWNLSVGVPIGETTTLMWDSSKIPADVFLTLDGTDMKLHKSMELGEGSHLFVIQGSISGPTAIIDTGSPANPYPSISGTYIGTITPNQTITVNKLYTYPCTGTGGHTEYVRIYNESETIAEAKWAGYKGDWHNITFSEQFTLEEGKTHNYTIKTGSYPQIIHKHNHTTLDGSLITCTKFIDANGKEYNDWIPAIRLFR